MGYTLLSSDNFTLFGSDSSRLVTSDTSAEGGEYLFSSDGFRLLSSDGVILHAADQAGNVYIREAGVSIAIPQAEILRTIAVSRAGNYSIPKPEIQENRLLVLPRATTSTIQSVRSYVTTSIYAVRFANVTLQAQSPMLESERILSSEREHETTIQNVLSESSRVRDSVRVAFVSVVPVNIATSYVAGRHLIAVCDFSVSTPELETARVLRTPSMFGYPLTVVIYAPTRDAVITQKTRTVQISR